MINCSRLLDPRFSSEEVSRHPADKGTQVPRHLLRYSRVRSPMVVWNITGGCNLSCKHCYLGATAES